jgi:predicted nucleic acid-binding Zn ribbon protein
MDRIGGPLQELLARLRLTEPMVGWKAVEVWPEVVGDRVAARARAVAFRDGSLVVEVDSSTWMNELTYLKRRMIVDLNRRLGAEVVRDLRLQPASGEAAHRFPRRGE